MSVVVDNKDDWLLVILWGLDDYNFWTSGDFYIVSVGLLLLTGLLLLGILLLLLLGFTWLLLPLFILLAISFNLLTLLLLTFFLPSLFLLSPSTLLSPLPSNYNNFSIWSPNTNITIPNITYISILVRFFINNWSIIYYELFNGKYLDVRDNLKCSYISFNYILAFYTLFTSLKKYSFSIEYVTTSTYSITFINLYNLTLTLY